MSWWTTVAGLTPIAIHDADNISGAQLLDRVGSNHITATSALVSTISSGWFSVAGNSDPMALTTPITLPTTGVVAALWSQTGNVVVFSRAYNDTTGYLINGYTDAGTQYWYVKRNNAAAYFGTYGTRGSTDFTAVVLRATDALLYVNGTQVGNALSKSYILDVVAQIGFGANGGAGNFVANDRLSAVGFWSGSATQAEIIALEAACRYALISKTCKGFSSAIGQLSLAPSEALDATGVRNINRLQAIGVRDLYYGGTGRITGTVKEKSSPSNVPLHRKVLLIDEATRTVIREMWSDATTGAYTFNNVDMAAKYTVVTFDYLHNYRAVIADNLTPEAMP